jgi:hypothetical protein
VMLMPWMVLPTPRSMAWSPAVVTLMVGRAPLEVSMTMGEPPNGSASDSAWSSPSRVWPSFRLMPGPV